MRTYTAEQTADVLQVTTGTVLKLARTGRLNGVKIGRNWRFTEEALNQFLSGKRPDKPDPDKPDPAAVEGRGKRLLGNK